MLTKKKRSRVAVFSDERLNTTHFNQNPVPILYQNYIIFTEKKSYPLDHLGTLRSPFFNGFRIRMEKPNSNKVQWLLPCKAFMQTSQ